MRQVTETSRRKVRSAATFKLRNGISLTALNEEGNEEQSHLLRILLAVSEFDHNAGAAGLRQLQPLRQLCAISHVCVGSNNTNAIRNSILAQVAQQDIESAMASKGLQKVPESQNPELVLTACGGEHEQTSWNAWGMRGFGGMASISPEQNYDTTMVVSLYDLKQKELVWRGIAENTLSNNGTRTRRM